MARYTAIAESPAAVAAGVAFATVQAGAAVGFKLRRLTIGVRAGATAPSSQQLTVGLARVTTRGVTPAATNVGNKMDPNSAASGITGVDVAAFGTAPVVAATQWEASFNSQSGTDLPWEFLEEFIVAPGAANGIAFINVGNALPAAHLYTLGIEWEE